MNFKVLLITSLLILIGSSLPSHLFSQRLRKPPTPKPSNTEGYVSFGMQLNAMNYSGDIPAPPQMTRPGLGIFLARKFGPRSQMKLSLNYGRIEGDDFTSAENEGTYARNLHFRNDILELGFLTSIDLFPSYGKYYKRRNFTPYLFGGLALIHHNPQARIPRDQGEGWVDLQTLGTEGQGRPGYEKLYGKIQIALPLGLGLKWKINKRWDFGVESGVRFTFFDYLDDVSGEYPDMADLGNPLAVALSNRSLETTSARNGQERNLDAVIQRFGNPLVYEGSDGQLYRTAPSFVRGESTRGNPNSQDYYFITAFHLSYIVNVGLKCPQFLW